MKYNAPHPKPTPHEREMLTILIEECGEVIQAATKVLRFGLADQYRDGKTGKEQLGLEIGDVIHMVHRVVALDLVDSHDIDLGAVRKARRLETYLQTAPGDT